MNPTNELLGLIEAFGALIVEVTAAARSVRGLPSQVAVLEKRILALDIRLDGNRRLAKPRKRARKRS